MAEGTTDREDAEWLKSQARASKIYYELNGKYTIDEITSFCIHYLTAQAAGPLAEMDLFVHPAKQLGRWHYMMTIAKLQESE